MGIYLGEIASILTAICWTLTAVFFSLAGKEVGSLIVNRVRLLLAVVFLTSAHWLLLGSPVPLHAEPERWFWLSLSGIIGLAVADALLFQSYMWIGPRLGMLLMSVAPVVAALLAWLFLGETLGLWQIAGILLTVGGIAWVVMEDNGSGISPTDKSKFLWGILFGLGAGTGQAIGLITAKKGLGGDFPALSGNLIRMLAAATVIWVFAIARGQGGITLKRVFSRHPLTLKIVSGTFFGPFIGVWLSLLAVQLTHVGIASTLMALSPIFLLPVGYYVFHEKISGRAIVGTLVAMGGVSLLFLV